MTRNPWSLGSGFESGDRNSLLRVSPFLLTIRVWKNSKDSGGVRVVAAASTNRGYRTRFHGFKTEGVSDHFDGSRLDKVSTPVDVAWEGQEKSAGFYGKEEGVGP